MKIGMYVPEWPPGSSANGIVTYASYMIPALSKLGHHVTIITSADLDRHIPRRSLFRRSLYKIVPTYAWHADRSEALSLILKDLHVDILEIEESFGPSRTLGNIPVVIRLHGPWFLNKRHDDPMREFLEGRALKRANFISSPSRAILDATSRRYHLAQPSGVIPNPIDPDILSWIEPESLSILFVGRFDRIKGADLVIDAFARLSESHPELRLVFAGSDGEIDGKNIVPYVRSRLSESAFRRFEYLGKIPRSEAIDLMTRNSVTVVPSRHEIFPYTALEAMSVGCPLVAANVGGIPEMVSDGEDGLLFTAGNHTDLAHKIETLIGNQSLARSFSAASKLTASTFSSERIAVSMAEVYRRTAFLFLNADDPITASYYANGA